MKGPRFMSLYILDNKQNSKIFLYAKTKKEVSSFKALNQKRIPTEKISGINNISVMLNDPKAVLLLSKIDAHSETALKFCNQNNIPTIGIHCSPDHMPNYAYSCIRGSSTLFFDLLSYFFLYNKTNIAFFGFSPNPDDCYKANNIYRLYNNFTENDIFYLKNSFKYCFDSFMDFRYKYNAIICPNDFIAILLIKELQAIDPDYLKDRFIIGFMDTYISSLYHIPLTSITYEESDVVSAVSTIYRILNNNRGRFNTIDLRLKSKIEVRASTHYCPLKSKSDFLLPSVKRRPLVFRDIECIMYHSDPNLRQIILIENMLEKMNNIDFRILYEMLSGAKNQTICEKLFISHQTMQYHISRMFKTIEVTCKSDFIRKLSPFINPENLKQFIEIP